MDFADDAEQAAFRAELRAWARDRDAVATQDAGVDRADVLAAWYRDLADAGYVGLSFPREYGGGGRPPVFEAILNEELGGAGALAPPPVGHIGHAILDYGSERQKAELLPGLLACRTLWCQGFSEPEAGSDLASLRTRAEPVHDDGGVLVGYEISGQKIWTSGATWSHYCLLLARSEADEPRHRGLSVFVVPMATDGVHARPVTMADGTQDFAEVFFDRARVPADAVVGVPGQGWEIAMHMLGYERGPADMGWVGRFGRSIATVESSIHRGELSVDETGRRRLAEAWVQYRVLQLHVMRALCERDQAGRGSSGASEAGSVAKLLTTRVDQLLHHVLLDLLGARFVLDGREELAPYLWSRAQSIFGGTQQIQRTIVAQRVLGMPRA